MTNPAPHAAVQPKRGLSTAALILGLASIACLVLFIVVTAGGSPLMLAVAMGITAVIVGSIALKKGQPKAASLIGLITGGLVTLIGLAIIVFALLFVGAFYLESL